MIPKFGITAVGILLLTLAGFFLFPGHTYLVQDCQIWVPMIERVHDPSLFDKDIMARRPHLENTFYDEATLVLRQIPGFDIERSLQLQQLVTRGAAIAGVYFIATACGLSGPLALVVGALASLGAYLDGPAVLTVEYEPVPRGFALSLSLLAFGLLAQRRIVPATLALTAATLYHLPTTAPAWLGLFITAAFDDQHRRAWLRALAIPAAALVLLIVASQLQPGLTEPSLHFSRIPPDQEQLQRMRAPYNWLDLWPARQFWDYILTYLLSLAALWRVRRELPSNLRALAFTVSTFGLLSLPLSYALLARFKWAILPQWQLQRAIVFTVLAAIIFAAIAAVRAALRASASSTRTSAIAESAVWTFVVLLYPAHINLPGTDLRPELGLWLAAASLGIALLLWLAPAGDSRADNPELTRFSVVTARTWALAFAAAALPFFLLPGPAHIRAAQPVDSPELEALAGWARTNTSKDAVFQFADLGRDLQQGVFRARALRALYTDWKSGGQVNHHLGFTREWWQRWNSIKGATWEPGEALPPYRALGIDYVVFRASTRFPGAQPVYSNSKFVVYPAQP